MLCRFRVNLGRIDVESIKAKTGAELSVAKCVAGSELEIEQRAAELLVKCGVVEQVEEPPVKAVAKKPEVAGASK